MPLISFAAAWQEYRRAEPRLPQKPQPVASRRVVGIREVADTFDLAALDAWGVLNLGENAIAGAAAAVAALRRAGKQIAILSNSGSRDAAASAARLRRLGFDVSAEEIVSGVELVPEALVALTAPPPIGLIADSPAPLAARTTALLRLGDVAADYDRVSAVVFLSSRSWNEERHRLLEASLMRQRRPLVVGNPDIASPEPESMNAEPGWYAHRLADATGVRPIFCGKPFAAIYDKLRARHPRIGSERILCVGDTLHTDVLGGRAAGFRTLLIEEGCCRGQDALALAAESGIWPEFVAPRL